MPDSECTAKQEAVDALSAKLEELKQELASAADDKKAAIADHIELTLAQLEAARASLELCTACLEEKYLVEALVDRLQALHEELQEAPPNQRAAIIKRIHATQAELTKARGSLERCLGDASPNPELTLTWSARVHGMIPGYSSDSAEREITLSFDKRRLFFWMSEVALVATVAGILVNVRLKATSRGIVHPPDSKDGPRDMVIDATVFASGGGLIEVHSVTLDSSAEFANGMKGFPLSSSGNLQMIGRFKLDIGPYVYVMIEGHVAGVEAVLA